MAVSYEHNEEIQDLLQRIAKTHVSQEGAMATGYAIVCEWVDAESQYHLMTLTDADSSPWKLYGMLNHAMQNDIYDEEESDDGEEY